MNQTVVSLIDETTQALLRVKVETSCYGIDLMPEGFGSSEATPGYGSPIFLEYHTGKLMLRVWADINQEHPTHVIDLSGARESNRKKETNG